MRFKMYSVKDELTGKFMNPMFVEDNDIADSLAIRNFRTNVNDIKLWRENPSDYSLYLVGAFDDEAGAESTPLDKIASGRSVLNG